MRSIRLSLIVYFLVLLALALGGVSWFVYQTTAVALGEKQISTQKLIQAQYESQRDAMKTTLDQSMVQKAQVLVRNARLREHIELLFPLGSLGTLLQPQGYLNAPLWIASGHPAFSLRFRLHEIVIEGGDSIIPIPDPAYQSHEYFEVYNLQGRSQQRSENLGMRSLGLHSALRRKEFLPQFDNIEPEAGWKLRRVTLRANVPAKGARRLLGPNWPAFGKGPGSKGLKGFGPKGGGLKGPDMQAGKGRPGMFPPPVLYIQYARETAPADRKLRELAQARDNGFLQLDRETHDTLFALRVNLMWICLATFAGIVAGGWVLVQAGLAPLARLSDAVSKVSEKDFRLKVDPKDLPRELQPIAGRLRDTLNQLKRAFAREKQAAADISHELRTPLAAMMTTLELALRKSRTADQYREMLEDIRASGAQMAHLVERLLALARLDAGAVQLRPQEIDARDLARQCTNLIRPLAEARGLALRFHAPEPARLKVDPDKLREILNNLLHNAVEYNRPEGAIDLDVARVNGHVRLAVSDTGIGITPEQHDHIFERFFRADPSRHADSPHAGLGLAIVKSYLELMGGKIKVDSGASGTKFTIELPAS